MRRGATALIVVTLGACGGSVSEAEFIAAADDLCAAMRAGMEALPAPQSLGEVKAFGDQAAQIGAEAMADLRALEVPKGDEREVDAIFDKFQEGFDLLRQLVEAAEAKDEVRVQQLLGEAETLQKEGNDLAATYGMKDCAEE